MVHPTTKVVDVVMPAVTMTNVMKLRGDPPAIRDYLLVETRAPGEDTHYTEARFLENLSLFTGPRRNVYAIIQYGMEVIFYKWEADEGTALTKKLHLVKDVGRIMSLLEYMRDNPLPLADLDPHCAG